MRCPACDRDNIQGVDLCENCGMDLAGLDVQACGVDADDPFLTAPLSSLPLKQPLVLARDDSVATAVERMTRQGEGCVFIEDEQDELIGVVTERDITARVASRGRDPLQTRLEDVMTWNPVALQQDDPLAWALHRMGVDGYRHLPVVDGGRLVGFLSIRTVLRALVGA